MFDNVDSNKKNIFFELFIVLGLIVISFLIAISAINTAKSQGIKPFFYQNFFEPAIMLTCGKGYKQSSNPPASLQNFLEQKTNSFSCADLPESLALTNINFYGIWYYYLASAAVTWKILGIISWTALDKLLAVFFSLTIIGSYGIFRLGMNRGIGFLGSLVFASSMMHQHYLLYFHDYIKVPFLFASIFILGLLVTKSFNARNLRLLITIFGLILGIGYGFRPDILIVLPLAIITVLFFLPENGWRKFLRNGSLILILLVSFLITASPSFNLNKNNENNNGSMLPHVIELGLANDFNQSLLMISSVYDLLPQYNDMASYGVGVSYGQRIMHISPVYASKEYDKAVGLAYLSTMKIFPADFLAMTYSSILRILELPFDSPYVYKIYCGVFLTLGACAVIALYNMRIAVYVVLFIIYFLGYPAIQFDPRHYFHLIFWNIWALGFLLTVAMQQICILFRNIVLHKVLIFNKIRNINYYACQNTIMRITGLFVGTLFILIMPLLLARYYQTLQVKNLIHAYKTAPNENLSITQSKTLDKKFSVFKIQWLPKEQQLILGDDNYSEMLMLTLGGQECKVSTLNPQVHYAGQKPGNLSFTTSFTFPSAQNKKGELFLPVYFLGKEFYPESIIVPSEQEKCIQNIARINSQNFYPLWIVLKLPDGFESQVLYKRITLKAQPQMPNNIKDFSPKDAWNFLKKISEAAVKTTA